ncbi:hypothetical protein AVEN_25480-1 [Araneus ventricosus]|uniref:Uncharacterized protein n=1 Tax=Araneus ventricosus TaxID=182803 RepID=A0A4Y2CS75_ARAVE|nr:hypothetical protein AVEN_25480-1 [Araneus ventricosus]
MYFRLKKPLNWEKLEKPSFMYMPSPERKSSLFPLHPQCPKSFIKTLPSLSVFHSHVQYWIPYAILRGLLNSLWTQSRNPVSRHLFVNSLNVVYPRSSLPIIWVSAESTRGNRFTIKYKGLGPRWTRGKRIWRCHKSPSASQISWSREKEAANGEGNHPRIEMNFDSTI